MPQSINIFALGKFSDRIIYPCFAGTRRGLGVGLALNLVSKRKVSRGGAWRGRGESKQGNGAPLFSSPAIAPPRDISLPLDLASTPAIRKGIEPREWNRDVRGFGSAHVPVSFPGFIPFEDGDVSCPDAGFG